MPRRLQFERLERRELMAGNIVARVVDGHLIVRGDDAGNMVRIDVRGLPAGQVRLTPGPTSMVNRESLPVVLSGWRGDVRLDLRGGHDRATLDRLPVAGHVRAIGGPGNDIILLDRCDVAGSVVVTDEAGRDSLHLVGSRVGGRTYLETGIGRDVIVLSNSTFHGPVDVRAGAGDDAISLRSTFHGRLSVDPGPGQDTVSSRTVRSAFDFRHGAQGWQGGFADLPTGQRGFYELESGIRPLPDELASDGTGFLLKGNNHSDDLFMFLKRRLAAREGIVAGQTYQVRLRVVFASNAPSGAFGIGGAPGESVFLKAGAAPVEPRGVASDGFVRMNVDKGEQAHGGQAASVVGDIANGRSASARDRYVSLLRTHVHEFPATASPDGELWLLVGTDSGFEGTTALYYQRIEVELIPVPTAASPPPKTSTSMLAAAALAADTQRPASTSVTSTARQPAGPAAAPLVAASARGFVDPVVVPRTQPPRAGYAAVVDRLLANDPWESLAPPWR